MLCKKVAFGAALVALLVVLCATGRVVAGPPTEGPEGEGEVEPQGDVGILAMLGTAFTYQGQLKEDGSPVNGTCDFQFKLYDAAGDGTQVGSTQTKTNINVSNGLFTVQLDFGSDVFTGDARWLEVAVRCPAGGGSYTTLSPRQALTPAPYALALPGLWTQQNATSPNLIGGFSGNSVTAGVVGATIGGGGVGNYANRVTDDYGTVGGGVDNLAGDDAGTTSDRWYATVSGGVENTASGVNATIGGGSNNMASGPNATVGGGYINAASGLNATVGGGYINTASGPYATIAGGWNNGASGSSATVGGGLNNTASGDGATVGGGGRYNHASGGDATIGGGNSNTASGDYATIAGGRYNQATANYATVAGGGSDTPATGNRVTDDYGTVGGGYNNQAGNGGATNDKPYATVGGGGSNTASGYDATVGGGYGNTASDSHATVGGGYNNTASAGNATVGGGGSNTASSGSATVPGGYNNTASAGNATVGGGYSNEASGSGATVGGGWNNTASGGDATVSGGSTNTASGYYATIPGGSYNTAQGNNSFAAGTRANANNQGCFVWGDSTFADVSCNVNDRWLARASGGVWFYTNSGLTSGVYVAAGGTSWNSISDRATKENFTPVDGQAILEKLAALPVQEYNLRSQDPSIRHIGPVAQDFYAAFGYGESDRAINMEDADGVALAAMQELYQLLQEKDVQIAAQQQRIDDLEARVAALEQRPEPVEGPVEGAAAAPRPMQAGLLPGAGPSATLGAAVLLAGLALVWLARRGDALSLSKGGGR